MRAYVAVTDRDWYRFLRGRPDLDEVNFWQPGGSRQFTYLKPGERFLFKLHYPENKIVGGGMFAHSSILLHGDDVLLREVLAKDFEFVGVEQHALLVG